MTDDERTKKKQEIVEFLNLTPYYNYACNLAEIPVSTFNDWRKADLIFDAKCVAMRAKTLTKFVNRSSPEFVLTHADPETFKDKSELNIKGVLVLPSELIKKNEITPGTEPDSKG